MNGNEEKKEQAQRLLRSFTDIDDRFIAEAMEEPQSQSAVSGTSVSRKVNKYSRWALTAAACLTVMIVGSYVVLHHPAKQPAQKSEVTTLAESEKLYEPDAYDEVPAPEGMQFSDEVLEEAEDAAEAAGGTVGEAAEDSAEEAPLLSASAENEAVQIANPFIDAETLKEAEEIAGFGFHVPDAAAPYDHLLYRVMEGEMLEVIFADEEDAEGYRIRKAIGNDDISGDYNEYAEEKTVRLADGTQVTLRGEKENSWSAAVWTDSDYSYAVCAGEKAFTTDEILQMAEEMIK
ncbi:MAG: hypothetical protein II640_01720 [Lachnospiraceae bacterium]|nr:hypothetical protein [Lachnospiraceae bacterium]